MLDEYGPPHEATDHISPVLWQVLVAASEEQVLRALYPFKSLLALAFSRRTEYPFDHDFPAIWCSPIGLIVSRSWGADRTERLLQTEDPAEAVQKVVDVITGELESDSKTPWKRFRRWSI
jgi:hypothetical protein